MSEATPSPQASLRLIARRPGTQVRDLGPSGKVVTLGWEPDLPDLRDYSIEHEKVQATVEALKRVASGRAAMLAGDGEPPGTIDLRSGCSHIEDQLELGSCTAQAVVGLVEYLIRQAGGESELSRLFLYKVTRKLLGLAGDTGAHIRTTIKAAAAFGIPPEDHWPYAIRRFDEEPSAFLYSYARQFQALDYFRLDTAGSGGAATLALLKRTLAAELPVALGFPVYSSLSNAADIPYPNLSDKLKGGHAVLAVGYDDEHETADGEPEPSLIIRNSWGLDWGEEGYGYLPYRYVREGFARDLWTILNQEWLDGEVFQ